jgi:energy-converting hydrogenase Eha subunit G
MKLQHKPLQQLRYRIIQNVQQTGMTGTAVTEAGVMANIQTGRCRNSTTEEWQEKTKRILFIKQLVKIQCRNRRRNGII